MSSSQYRNNFDCSVDWLSMNKIFVDFFLFIPYLFRSCFILGFIFYLTSVFQKRSNRKEISEINYPNLKIIHVNSHLMKMRQ